MDFKTWRALEIAESILGGTGEVREPKPEEAFAAGKKEGEATLPNLEPVISWLKNGCNVDDAIKELEIYQAQMRSNV